jgi:hypothetical protein
MTVPDMTPEQGRRAAEFGEGYRAGLSDARGGDSRDAARHGDRYAAGYALGYRWGLDHQAPAVLLMPGGAW